MLPLEPRLPSLHDLGVDLLGVTPLQRRIALARPFVGVLLYVAAVWCGWWWLTPLIVFLIFIAIVTVTHDVVHGSLGLSRRQTEWALFACGAILFESGHAYRQTHLRHHAVFPGPDDPEGNPARMSLWQAVAYGPFFLPRLWFWAFHRTRGSTVERCWLLAEAGWFGLGLSAAVILWPITKGLACYVTLALIGSWVYPLLTVHLPHRHYGDTPLTQTHTLRGRVIPKLFLELTYHLEHHLYPQVPSHNLPLLARRLEPVFEQSGVAPTRVP